MGIVWIILLLVVASGFAYWRFRARNFLYDDYSPREQPIWGKQFICGTHSSGAYACDSAIEMHGRSFGLDELPSVPLSGCDTLNCQCQLVPLVDRRVVAERRSGNERRDEIRFIVELDGESKPPRRSRRDRRKDRDSTYHWDHNI